MQTETYQKEVYLGDGLYASNEGFQIVLRAPRESGDHVICLDPSVAIALFHFMKIEWPTLFKNVKCP